MDTAHAGQFELQQADRADGPFALLLIRLDCGQTFDCNVVALASNIGRTDNLGKGRLDWARPGLAKQALQALLSS